MVYGTVSIGCGCANREVFKFFNSPANIELLPFRMGESGLALPLREWEENTTESTVRFEAAQHRIALQPS